MVNTAEERVRNEYEARGWITIRGGAPDFVFVKRDIMGKLSRIKFVEVKLKPNPQVDYEQFIGVQSSELRPNQILYREVLEAMGADYVLRHIDRFDCYVPKEIDLEPVLSQSRRYSKQGIYEISADESL